MKNQVEVEGILKKYTVNYGKYEDFPRWVRTTKEILITIRIGEK